MRPKLSESVLIVVDVQPTFFRPIHDGEAVFRRIQFVVEAARALAVPILATEQVPAKMGGTDPRLAALMPESTKPVAKACFGCCESPDFQQALARLNRGQAALVGIETHICVSQTALGLIEQGLQVAFCPDAVGARALDRHEAGIERMRAAGVESIHTEALVYEWMGSAEHQAFREVLEIVKRAGP